MLKIAGLSLISLCIVLIGFSKADELKNNCNYLKRLRDFIEYSRENIRYEKVNVERMMTEYEADGRKLPADNGISAVYLRLKDDFFSRLGTSDSFAQAQMCEYMLCKVNTEIEKASEEYARRGKVLRALSALLAMAIMIVFI